MSEGNSGGPSNPPKAVPSLVKKQSDVTRLGTQKLKFVPTLPARRKKEDAKEQEAAPVPSTSADRGRGRGRGRGEDRGRGRGRGDGPGRGGAPPRPPQVEMTASGPFAMGPAMQGAAGARRAAPQSNFMPIMPGGPSRGPLGAGLTNTTAPGVGIKREVSDLGLPKKEEGPLDDDGEVYSDPDEGVEIVDMENVRGMDWMAPESLRKEKAKGKGKGKARAKEADAKGKGAVKPDVEMADAAPSRVQSEDADSAVDSGEAKVNLANALNLSDSEEEEEMEDIIHDFASRLDVNTDGLHGSQPLYFFQFPQPFPTFVSPSTVSADDKGKGKETISELPDVTSKKVSFAPDVKRAAPSGPSGQPTLAQPGQTTDAKQEAEPTVEGVIGQLEVYASGIVKMRLSNGILLDVTGSTQPSFLQHVVHVDKENKRLCVLGEVYRRFSVAPDVDALLETLENAANQQPVDDLGDLDGLIVMDTT